MGLKAIKAFYKTDREMYFFNGTLHVSGPRDAGSSNGLANLYGAELLLTGEAISCAPWDAELGRLLKAIAADTLTFRDLLMQRDTHEQAYPVYTFEGASVFTRNVDRPDWQELDLETTLVVTHDGHLLKRGNAFATQAEAAAAAKEHARSTIVTQEALLSQEDYAPDSMTASLFQALLASARADLAKLELAFPV